MAKNKQRLNRNRRPNIEMGLFNKETSKSNTKEIRKIVDKLMTDGNKLMLKYEIDRIGNIDKDKSLVDFMRFLLADVQKGLKKINNISHEIDKSNNLKQKNEKVNK